MAFAWQCSSYIYTYIHTSVRTNACCSQTPKMDGWMRKISRNEIGSHRYSFHMRASAFKDTMVRAKCALVASGNAKTTENRPMDGIALTSTSGSSPLPLIPFNSRSRQQTRLRARFSQVFRPILKCALPNRLTHSLICLLEWLTGKKFGRSSSS